MFINYIITGLDKKTRKTVTLMDETMRKPLKMVSPLGTQEILSNGEQDNVKSFLETVDDTSICVVRQTMLSDICGRVQMDKNSPVLYEEFNDSFDVVKKPIVPESYKVFDTIRDMNRYVTSALMVCSPISEGGDYESCLPTLDSEDCSVFGGELILDSTVDMVFGTDEAKAALHDAALPLRFFNKRILDKYMLAYAYREKDGSSVKFSGVESGTLEITDLIQRAVDDNFEYIPFGCCGGDPEVFPEYIPDSYLSYKYTTIKEWMDSEFIYPPLKKALEDQITEMKYPMNDDNYYFIRTIRGNVAFIKDREKSPKTERTPKPFKGKQQYNRNKK